MRYTQDQRWLNRSARSHHSAFLGKEERRGLLVQEERGTTSDLRRPFSKNTRNLTSRPSKHSTKASFKLLKVSSSQLDRSCSNTLTWRIQTLPWVKSFHQINSWEMPKEFWLRPMLCRIRDSIPRWNSLWISLRQDRKINGTWQSNRSSTWIGWNHKIAWIIDRRAKTGGWKI